MDITNLSKLYKKANKFTEVFHNNNNEYIPFSNFTMLLAIQNGNRYYMSKKRFNKTSAYTNNSNQKIMKANQFTSSIKNYGNSNRA